MGASETDGSYPPVADRTGKIVGLAVDQTAGPSSIFPIAAAVVIEDMEQFEVVSAGQGNPVLLEVLGVLVRIK